MSDSQPVDPCIQEELDAIADRLNNRPRAIHGFYPPIAVYQAMLEKLTQASHSLQ